MSSKKNKRIKTTDNKESNERIIQKRNGFALDSFNRFRDDLVQVIVDYLPLKQKLIFTSVSKQFNKCLFQKEIDLIIDTNNANANQFNSIEELIETKRKDQKSKDINEEEEQNEVLKKVNKTGFEWIVKKCKFIRKMDLRNCLFEAQIIELICNNCPNLKEIYLMEKGLKEKYIIQFGEKCGKRLEKLVIERPFGPESGFVKSLLNYCQNLRTFHNKTNSFIDSNKEFLPKLESIDIILSDKDLHLFKTVCEKYSKQMISIDVTLRFSDGNGFNYVLEKISSFTHLKQLFITIEGDPKKNLKPIDSFLTEIAKNCTEINRLAVVISGCNCTPKLISGNIFSVFGLFHNLKAFEAQLPGRSSGPETHHTFVSKLNNLTKSATIQGFEHCNKLTQFVLNYTELDHKFLKNIDKYLPNLEFVSLETAGDINDIGLKALAKLKKLKFFQLSKDYLEKDTFYGITDTGVKALINGCKNIETIVFRGRPDISPSTIKCLIRAAKSRPEKKIQFICNYMEYVEVGAYTPIHMKKFPNLPNNLKITVYGPGDNLSDEESDEED